ncbi:actinorhodin polyketide dimerase ActVA [Amycolatopsis cihanbeyliensis]
MPINQLPTPVPQARKLCTADLVAAASADAAEGESRRRLTPEVAEALLRAGFARHFVPSARGGTAGGFTELADALDAVGGGCLSAAWCGLIYATSGRMAAYLPPEGQREVWAEGPDTAIVAGLVPSGEVEPAPGGWLLSGSWRPVSAVDHATWALLCAPAGGARESEARFFAVPRSDFAVRDTWDTVGMRATGSHTVVLDGVLVPEHRVFSRAALIAGAAGAGAQACHRVPLLGAAPPLFASVSVGAARAALRHLVELTAARPETAREPAALEAIAMAGAEIDSAAMLVHRACAATDTATPVGADLAARGARDAAFAARLLRDAVHRAFLAGGGQAQDSASPLQRIWRDVHGATSHAVLRWERNADLHARALLDGG